MEMSFHTTPSPTGHYEVFDARRFDITIEIYCIEWACNVLYKLSVSLFGIW